MPKSRIELNSASESITISLPGWLIELMDDVCASKDYTRSTFCKRAVKKALLLSKTNDIAFFENMLTDNGNPVLMENNKKIKK